MNWREKRREIGWGTHLLVILLVVAVSVLLERLAYLHYDSLRADPVIVNRFMAVAPVYNKNGSWLHGRWGIGYRFGLLCLEHALAFLAGLFLFRFIQAYNAFFSMSETWLLAVDVELAVPVYRCVAWLYSPYTLDYLYVKGYGTFDFPDLCIGTGIFLLVLWMVLALIPYYRFRKARTKGMRFWEKFKWEWRFTAGMVRAVFLKREQWAMAQYAVRELNNKEITFLYDTYMRQDFPADELKPLSHIIKSVEEGYGFSLGLYEEERLAGYAVFILCEETKCALLDYFAILPDRRGEGLGHRAFLLFDTYFKENLPLVEGLYIESERVAAAKNEKQRLTRERRIAFYESCGCEMTGLRSVLFGVDYSVLYMRMGNSAQGASLAALDALYRRMFKPEHYGRCVSLTDLGCRNPEETV